MGQLPHRIIIGLVKSSDYNGSRTSNPFLFHHFNLNHISLTINGLQTPNEPYEPDFTNKLVRREYHHLLETLLGSCQDERSLGISLEQFINGGKTLFGFTPMGDWMTNSCYTKEFGNINLRIRFSKATEENLTVIVYAEYQNLLEIDATREIHVDFN